MFVLERTDSVSPRSFQATVLLTLAKP